MSSSWSSRRLHVHEDVPGSTPPEPSPPHRCAHYPRGRQTSGDFSDIQLRAPLFVLWGPYRGHFMALGCLSLAPLRGPSHASSCLLHRCSCSQSIPIPMCVAVDTWRHINAGAWAIGWARRRRGAGEAAGVRGGRGPVQHCCEYSDASALHNAPHTDILLQSCRFRIDIHLLRANGVHNRGPPGGLLCLPGLMPRPPTPATPLFPDVPSPNNPCATRAFPQPHQAQPSADETPLQGSTQQSRAPLGDGQQPQSQTPETGRLSKSYIYVQSTEQHSAWHPGCASRIVRQRSRNRPTCTAINNKSAHGIALKIHNAGDMEMFNTEQFCTWSCSQEHAAEGVLTGG